MIFRNLSNHNKIFPYSKVFEWRFIIFGTWNLNFSSTRFKDCYDYIEFRCHNMNKCNKTSAFPILIVYYVPRRMMRVITQQATMLAGDRNRGAIRPASILSESRNYPNCVHWRIFYFMWIRRIYEFFYVHSNPIWKGQNCRDYRLSHLKFREYFRPF